MPVLLLTRRASKQVDSPKQTPKNDLPDNPEIPQFSLDALDIKRKMMVFIYGILGVFGTVETWFWYQWAKRWWEGKAGEGSDNPA